MEKKVYTDAIDRLVNENELSVEAEHEFIHEFFEGVLPLFKLMYSEKADKPEFEHIIIVSFHIDIDAATAIMWFLKIRQAIEAQTLHITNSYVRDENGNTLLGSEAELYRHQRIENEVIRSMEEESEEQPAKPSIKFPVITSKEDTIREFEQLMPKKGQKFN